MSPLDPRDRWARAAAGWEARADWFRDATMPVTTWMIDAVRPQPGQTILDLAAGIGDVKVRRMSLGGGVVIWGTVGG